MGNHRIQSGYSLIELLIVVAIVGILTAIAIPNYSTYITRARVSDATGMLASYRLGLEQYYQDNRNYGQASCGIAPPATTQFFDYECKLDEDRQGYLITASGKAGTGTREFVYKLDHNGSRSTSSMPASWAAVDAADCWILSPGATC